MKIMITACCLALAVNTSIAWAECARPDARPEVVDGAKATKEQMIASNNAVKAYVDELKNYLLCLEAEEKTASKDGSDTEETRAARLTEYNSAVDDMSTLADQLNTEIREYKAKNQ